MANMVLNGTFDTNVANWTSYFAAMTRDTTQKHTGSASMKLVNQLTTAAGAYSNVINTIVGTKYTSSLWVKGSGAFQYGFYATDTSTWYAQTPATTLTGAWQQLTLDWVSTHAAITVFAVVSTYQQTVYVDDVFFDVAPVAPGGKGSVIRSGAKVALGADSVVRSGVKAAVTPSVLRGGIKKSVL